MQQETTRPPAAVDLQPHLIGDLVELRPLRMGDWDALFAVASDPLIWEQHPARDRYRPEVFRTFFLEALASGGAFVVVDRQSGQVIGSSRYFGYAPARREIEIGWTFLARACWGGRYNADLKRLMLRHAFTFVDRVIFLVGASNLRSRKALEKIGAVLTERRNKTDADGHVLEQVVYAIDKNAAGVLP
jgi:RimJ/RimL family protein N-acetyltransferase